jgi:hypothetical protein
MNNGLEKIHKWCTQELILEMCTIMVGIYLMNRLHQEISRDNTKWRGLSSWKKLQELLNL